MREPSPVLFELARQLVRHEACGAPGPSSAPAALGRARDKVRGELESLLGAGGVEALVRRAETLAKRDFPAAGGESRTASPDPEGAEAASAAVLAYLLGLLVNLLGEELGLLPVRKLWPDVAPGMAAPRSTDAEA